MSEQTESDAVETVRLSVIKPVASEDEFIAALNELGKKLGREFNLRDRDLFIKRYGLHLAAMGETPESRIAAQTLVIHNEHMNHGKKFVDAESTAAALAAIDDYRNSLRGRFSPLTNSPK